MRELTEHKTITGIIKKVSQSRSRSTNWGEFLFCGREVIVNVMGATPSIITMYVRDNSWITEMKIPPDNLIDKPMLMTVHGETIQDNLGCIFIDKVEPICESVETVDLRQYFELD